MKNMKTFNYRNFLKESKEKNDELKKEYFKSIKDYPKTFTEKATETAEEFRDKLINNQ